MTTWWFDDIAENDAFGAITPKQTIMAYVSSDYRLKNCSVTRRDSAGYAREVCVCLIDSDGIENYGFGKSWRGAANAAQGNFRQRIVPVMVSE